MLILTENQSIRLNEWCGSSFSSLRPPLYAGEIGSRLVLGGGHSVVYQYNRAIKLAPNEGAELRERLEELKQLRETGAATGQAWDAVFSRTRLPMISVGVVRSALSADGLHTIPAPYPQSTAKPAETGQELRRESLAPQSCP
jgi:hypothetical protein